MNCEEMRTHIAQMSVAELRTVRRDGHLANCPECSEFLQDMLHLSAGLEALTIPRPGSMAPPTPVMAMQRPRVLTLLAATLTMLLVGALAAFIYTNYLVAEDVDGSGTREALFYRSGSGSKKVKIPLSGQSKPERSKPSPSSPSRN